MTDGTTATTLAPSEDEMRKVTEVFAQMRDAVIDASRLGTEVAELRQSVEEMKGELASLRETNRWMDGQITELRKQRDEAEYRVQETAHRRDELSQELSHVRSRLEHQREELNRLNLHASDLVKERNDADLRAMELEEENKALKAQLGKIIETLGGVAAFKHKEVEEPKPTTTAHDDQPRAEGGQFQPKAEEDTPNVETQRTDLAW